MRNLFKKIYYFLPVNLLVLHLKKNQVLLFFWLFFFLAVNGGIGRSFGLHYLFLDPEYLGSVNFLSMFLMGLCLGVFTLSFFITTFILDSHRYRFLGQSSKPFFIFSLNNSIIPIAFLIFYLVKLVLFQRSTGLMQEHQICFQIGGLLLGYLLVLVLIFVYFSKTNRSALYDLVDNIDESLQKSKSSSQRTIRKILTSRKSNYKIRTYLSSPLRIKKVLNNIPLNKEAVTKVFDQNHLNAIFVEMILFIVIISLGFYKDFEVFRIPAGSSTFLFISFVMMFTGALFYWLRGWSISVVLVCVLVLNSLMENGWIKSHYEAFGISYKSQKQPYTKEQIQKLNTLENYQKDKKTTLEALNNWKSKFPNTKPKMVLITASGGGQRSSLWTTTVLQAIDERLDKKLLKHTTLMTGASGGMIGSSFYRELYLRDLAGETNLLDQAHLNNISKDILNPMIFSMLVSDLIFRFQKFEYQGKIYYKGRGYAFEETLNDNVGGIMGKTLQDYQPYEASGQIPMVIIAPTIINDGRKLFIGSQSVSYMNTTFEPDKHGMRDRGIDFQTFFAAHNPEQLRFLSALRMSATFPYITPNIHLPSHPEIEIMDAGLSDNFGTSDALKYLFVFKKWIEQNTSGVVLISIRDTEKNPEISPYTKKSIFTKIFNPINGLYKNWDNIQDNNNDQTLEVLSSIYQVPIQEVLFEYTPKTAQKPDDRASLSWHLTAKEKQSIARNIQADHNQKSIQTTVELLTK